MASNPRSQHGEVPEAADHQEPQPSPAVDALVKSLGGFTRLPDSQAPKHHREPLDGALKQIRVLDVAPGDFHEPLICSTRVISLLDDPVPLFETIFYCWGTSDAYSNIELNRVVVKIPVTSEAAVRRMRLPDRPRVLWIDAICIDQNSDSEKSVQVGMMASVYRAGIQNLVYLGEDPRQMAKRAMASIGPVFKEMSKETDDLRLLSETINHPDTGLWLYSDQNFDRSTNIDERALLGLFEKP